MLVRYSVSVSTHQNTSLTIARLGCTTVYEIFHFFYQAVFLQTTDSHVCSRRTLELETTDHIIYREFLWQTAKALIRLLTALHVH